MTGGGPLSQPGDTDQLVELLYECAREKKRLTFVVGSGLSLPVIPDVRGMLAVADLYAQGHPVSTGLLAALELSRNEFGSSIATYRAYWREFAKWIAKDEFDLIAQDAVLRAYQSTNPTFSGRGRWQRLDPTRARQMERDLHGWNLPDGLAALGGLLAAMPESFVDGQILTTNFDPLLEVAIKRAGRVAVSVPLDLEAETPLVRASGAILVHHLHGFWRDDPRYRRQRLLHDPDYLDQHHAPLARQVSKLITTDTVCIVGHSGWDGIVADALRLTALEGRELTVLWAARSEGGGAVLERRFHHTASAAHRRPSPRFFSSVEGDALFTRLAERFRITVGRGQKTARRHRHSQWERELISEPGTVPPTGSLDLLRQLDRRFHWERSWSGSEVAPSLVYWPVRLRARPSVINMVQALAAAALSARGARIVLCLDDFNVEEADRWTEIIRQDVRRWCDLVPNARWPEVVRLKEFVEYEELHGRRENPEPRLRPTRPWDVAREAIGDRNPSVLALLMAAKIIPDYPPDQLMENAEKIVRGLESRSARHLLTPFTLFAHLNDLVQRHGERTESVMTLGGREEKKLWQFWRFAFDRGVNQLYNPTIRSLTNDSLALRWTSFEELRSYLRQGLRDDAWAENGNYISWLAQNAFLLPMYLRADDPPSFAGTRLDSWPAVRQAIRSDQRVIDVIAKEVSEMYLGGS